MRLRSSSDTCGELEERGMSGRHKRSLWPAGQCGRSGDGRGERFLRYGAGLWCFLGGDTGSCVFPARCPFLAVGGAGEKIFSPAIKLCID